MKWHLIGLLSVAMLLSACNIQSDGKETFVGIGNPASQFCVEKQGNLIIRKDQSGNEYGVCRFADGSEMEEWNFYRQHH